MELNKKSTDEYASLSLSETYAFLQTSHDGLASASAAERLQQFGRNEVTEQKSNPVWEFLKRYWGPMPWLLEFSIILTMIIGHYTESMIIFLLLSINAVIGHLQSQNSHKVVSLMKKRLQTQAKVLRDGHWQMLDSPLLVPGDVISLKQGDIVPADVRLFSGTASVDQSALTGESQPKDVKESGIVYSGSIIKQGSVQSVVLSTGERTYFGKTVGLVKIAKPKSKQQEVMLTIVRYLLYLGIIISVIVAGYAVYLRQDVLSILSLIVMFLIASVPVALPAVLTIVQAYGASELSQRGVLVTKLDSLEDAASIDVFCFDKTGTITQNNLSVVDITPFGSYRKEAAAELGAAASREEGLDAIDVALLRYVREEKLDADSYKQLSYTPFDPTSKKTQASVEHDGRQITVIKGAVQTILSLCEDQADINNRAADVTEAYSEKGFKTLAVAVSADDKYELAGIIAIADPPQPDASSMIQKMKDLGVRCLMLTGDSAPIARQIASLVGIGGNIQPASVLNGKTKEEQLKLVTESDGFAEVYPVDKYNIVKLFQESGHLVGMTGDGVNDAPALKQAELGTAVSDAMDIARASAAIILTQKGLGGIIDAVALSRETYQRMLTWVISKIRKVIEVFILLAVGFFWKHDMILSILDMSLLVFANDFATMSIATDNVQATDTPDQWSLKRITVASAILGIFYALGDWGMLSIGLRYFPLNADSMATLILLCLVFNSQFAILLVRERRHFWKSMPSKQLLFTCFATIFLFALMGVLGWFIAPIPITLVILTLGISLGYTVALDFVKCAVFKQLKI